MKSGFWNRACLGLLAVCCAGAIFSARAWAQETKETITVEGMERSYVVHLPKGYDEKQHYPMVVLLHGINQQADDMERLTRFNDLADKDSVIAVYPSALHGRWNFGAMETVRTYPRRGPYGRPGWGGYPRRYPGGPPRESERERPAARVDDIDFFNRMLDKLGTRFAVDTSRVYFAGLSDGGFMAMKLGCGLADRIAGIATVGAAMPKTMVCVPSRPLPVMLINGTSDPVVKYGGGETKNSALRTISAEDTAKEWSRLNRCNEKPAHSKLNKTKGGMETKIDTFEGCQENSAVLLYSVKGGGNTWPGGEQYEVEKSIGKTSQDFNANEEIWKFLVTRKLGDKSADQKPSDQKPAQK